MASQITHLVLADKVYEKLFFRFDKQLFYCGNIFPDIRYLKVIGREQTHFQKVTLKEILSETDPFVAGMKLHSLVDEVLEKFMQAKKVYELCPPSDYVTQTYKLYQDEMYYGKITDWKNISTFLGNFREAKFNIPSEHVNFWYDVMTRYASNSPTDESREAVITSIGFPESVAKKMNSDISLMRGNEKLTQRLEEFYESFDKLIHGK
ncbi:MAG TPA: hypothetical protein VEC17_01495 [Candidatus Binatia bacterium]|nr:hypothetical protein [Candidatus Binatia bacterium]